MSRGAVRAAIGKALRSQTPYVLPQWQGGKEDKSTITTVEAKDLRPGGDGEV